MDTKIFVNLPVKDLNRSMTFFSQLGFTFNTLFTNENAACLIIGKDIYVMLLVEEFFKTFTKKDLADSAKSTEVILALSADSREQVDEMVHKALAAGGKPSNEPDNKDFMYGWGFQDPDDHLWEVYWMDPAAIGEA